MEKFQSTHLSIYFCYTYSFSLSITITKQLTLSFAKLFTKLPALLFNLLSFLITSNYMKSRLYRAVYIGFLKYLRQIIILFLLREQQFCFLRGFYFANGLLTYKMFFRNTNVFSNSQSQGFIKIKTLALNSLQI